jgi:hypothetical protein
MESLGWILIVAGVILSIIGIVILSLGTTQLLKQMFGSPTAATGGVAGFSMINLADLTKLIEAIIKMPQWLLALLAADVQIYLGYWLVKGARLF